MGLSRLLASAKERQKNERAVRKSNRKLKAKLGKDVEKDALVKPVVDMKLSMEKCISSLVHHQAGSVHTLQLCMSQLICDGYLVCLLRVLQLFSLRLMRRWDVLSMI